MTNNRKNFDENMKKENTRFIEENDARLENDTCNDVPSPVKKRTSGLVIATASIAMAIAVAIGGAVFFANNSNQHNIGTPSATVATIHHDEKPKAKKATEKPTEKPTQKPTQAPTAKPTEKPTQAPTAKPTEKPTQAPTAKPTEAPTQAPTAKPTEAPTQAPTAKPTEAPAQAPTVKPTEAPTEAPTAKPTEAPTEAPTVKPTEAPTEVPTEKPTEDPHVIPTVDPHDVLVMEIAQKVFAGHNIQFTDEKSVVLIDGERVYIDTKNVAPENTGKAFHFVVNGKTADGFKWDFKADYNYDKGQYDFTFYGAKEGTTHVNGYYYSADGVKVPVKLTLNVDGDLNVTSANK